MISTRLPDDNTPPEPGLVERWAKGWALTRGAAPPAREGEAWRIEVGQPQQKRRYIFARPGPGITALARSIVEPWVYIKVCGAPEAIAPYLPEPWQVERHGYFMSRATLGRPAASSLPQGYRLSLERKNSLMLATIQGRGGALAASGSAALIGDLAVFNDIITEPACRRRGLARALMTALVAAALGGGGRHGALVSTPDGYPLYLALRWQLRSLYTTAHIPA